ncbi:MAG: Ppx/GppA family phosphatase [Ignavibacteria bacterium]|nr:Ppx/GppA family phosphatase [Ignavibacteria bacterium]
MNNNRIAAIDLGTNSFHLVIVELKNISDITSLEELEANNNFNILYRQREIVRINVGENNQTNRLTNEGINRAIKVLKQFKTKIEEYGAVTHAIATSAIREAENRDEFLNYVKDNLGIEIKVVSGFEEAHLIYLGVLQGLNVYDKQILLIDIGGGSTELLIGKQGRVLYASSFKLGAVRLAQKFFDGGKTFSKKQKQECIEYIQNTFAKNLKPIERLGFEKVIGTSGQIQSIARLLYLDEIEKIEYRTFHDVEFSTKQFENVSRKLLECEKLDEVKSIKTIDEKRAEIIIPGTLILKEIIEKLKIQNVTVCNYALREGIIIDAIEKHFNKNIFYQSFSETEDLTNNLRMKSILELAKFYNVDLKHALQVRKIAITLFNEFSIFHQLDKNALELLEYAALLHDIGYHISSKKHHKYSYYIIKNSGLVGFSDKEIEIISNIARYHRKALPNEKHENFVHFTNEEKYLIKILAAILRLSDGLEKTHRAVISDIKLFSNGNGKQYLLVLRYLTHPPLSEMEAAKKRKRILENYFNIKIELKLEKITT